MNMDQLYLMRHGIAVPSGSAGYEEDDRPLTNQGERRVRRIARGLAAIDVKFDRILTSPLSRAHRTAEIVADEFDAPDILETADELRAGHDAATIKAWLETRPERRVMIVGHDPSFTDLVGWLLFDKSTAPLVNLRKGGVVAFTAKPEGGWLLDWMSRPRLFLKLMR
jgi:phosphohistidine phosphatase